jgi:hypothetical protein
LPPLKRLLVAAVLAMAVPAADARAGDLAIEVPWARATPPGATVGAGYMVIRDTGKAGDRLVGAATPVAAMVQVHEVESVGGEMRMRERPAVEIPPGGSVRLEPGGLHLMLVDLARPLVAGERVPLTLVFEKAGRVTVELAVAPPGAPGPSR